jgi:hypothetical protein
VLDAGSGWMTIGCDVKLRSFRGRGEKHAGSEEGGGVMVLVVAGLSPVDEAM